MDSEETDIVVKYKMILKTAEADARRRVFLHILADVKNRMIKDGRMKKHE